MDGAPVWETVGPMVRIFWRTTSPRRASLTEKKVSTPKTSIIIALLNVYTSVCFTLLSNWVPDDAGLLYVAKTSFVSFRV